MLRLHTDDSACTVGGHQGDLQDLLTFHVRATSCWFVKGRTTFTRTTSAAQCMHVADSSAVALRVALTI